MNVLILFGVIVAAEVVADRAITYLDDRRNAKLDAEADAPKTWAGMPVFAHQSVLDKIIGNLTPEQKQFYGWMREKLSNRQTSDAPREGASVGENWKPPTQQFGPYGPPPQHYGYLSDGLPYLNPVSREKRPGEDV